MKTVVLAEKPSVGKEIARVLGCRKSTKSYIEGPDYIVTWAMGHLVELADPGEYDQQWKSWDMSYLPMLPQRMKHKVIKRTSHQFRAIKGIFNRKDVNNLVIATDAGREGELVARWIMRLGGWKKPFQRLWISSQTDSAIKAGFKNLKPGRSYDNLFWAAESRAEADWIIGLNITRALSCKFDARLSAGRVQTPTLAMIINREIERNNFEPQPFWTLEADFDHFLAKWRGNNGQNRFSKLESAQAVSNKVDKKSGTITEYQVKEKSEPPPLAYDLTALQRDANRILGFSAKKTLQTLQILYERYKIVTYPRTDSRYITTDMVGTLKDRLKAIGHTKYSATVKELLQGDLKVGKRLVDDKKVTDHHAIIPTEEKVNLDKLTPEERALWDLIAKRFLAVLSRPYKAQTITMTITVEGENFMVRGLKTLDKGWKGIAGADNREQSEDDEDYVFQDLSKFKKGDNLTVKKTAISQGMTKPPARYTEGTLLGAMENPQKFIADKALKASIEKGGLGTPATRADIIEKLFSNYYIERQGKELVPTPHGYELIEIVPDQLKSPELTAIWEQRLSKIADGKEKGQNFTKDIRENAKELIVSVKKSSAQYKPRNLTKEACPMCGKNLMNVKDKKGRNLKVCPSRSCGYEEDTNQNDGFNRKPSKRERAMNKQLINKYADNNAKDTFTLADMLKASMDKKKRK